MNLAQFIGQAIGTRSGTRTISQKLAHEAQVEPDHALRSQRNGGGGRGDFICHARNPALMRAGVNGIS